MVVLEETWQVTDGNSQFNLTGHGGNGEVVGYTVLGLRDSVTVTFKEQYPRKDHRSVMVTSGL